MLDDERLKNPQVGNDYFEELTRRIQDIRTSERRFYQKITDIYATSIDYDKDAPLTQTFFATVQHKVHYAIHGQTPTEVITARADRTLPNMGLTNWEGARIRKADVGVAKNYLNEPELRALGNLVEQYLIFAQSQAERRVPMTMHDWITKLEGFLRLNDREVLTNAGKVSAELKGRTGGAGSVCKFCTNCRGRENLPEFKFTWKFERSVIVCRSHPPHAAQSSWLPLTKRPLPPLLRKCSMLPGFAR